MIEFLDTSPDTLLTEISVTEPVIKRFGFEKVVICGDGSIAKLPEFFLPDPKLELNKVYSFSDFPSAVEGNIFYRKEFSELKELGAFLKYTLKRAIKNPIEIEGFDKDLSNPKYKIEGCTLFINQSAYHKVDFFLRDEKNSGYSKAKAMAVEAGLPFNR